MQPTPDATIATLQAELAALRAEMQSFAYTVSHDLRAPLRHIVSYAQLVQEDAGPLLNAEVQGFLGTITDSAHHLGVMLDALLELSRVGTAPVHLAPMPLQDVLGAVVAGLQAQNAGRAIDWHIAPDLPTVMADAVMLRSVLEQVLGNACKFTGKQEHTRIEVSAELDAPSGLLVLSVQDNGAGFNPAMAAKLFQPFQRMHSAQQFAGLGMGLALARKMLQRMGGEVSAVAEVDGGCTVRLVLPHGG